MGARRDRLRHDLDLPKELHFPKPCSFLPLFVGPSVLFPQDPLADVCWTILELDAVRTAMKLKGSRDRGVDIRLASSFCSRKMRQIRRRMRLPGTGRPKFGVS